MSELEDSGLAPAAGPPPVLVGVVHWNDLPATRACLESLAASTCACQIMVVDNASSDGSGDALRRLFPAVEVWTAPDNLLFAGGANRVLQEVMTRNYSYGIIMNNDTRVESTMVTELVAAAEAEPEAGLLGPKIFYESEPELIWSAGGRIHWWSGQSAHLGLRRRDGPEFDIARDVDYLTGCCLLVRRSVVQDIGLFDTTYTMYSEDADYCLRARRAGYRVRLAPRARMWHAVSRASGGGTTPYKMYHRVRSNWLLVRRHARPVHWLTIPFLAPLAFAKFAVGQLARGDWAVVGAGFRALWDTARRAPRRRL